MRDLIFAMVESDKIVQWLMGDKKRQDQLRFLYEVCKVIFETCLKDTMIDDTKNQTVLEQIIPPLCSFMTMKNILRI